MHPGKDVIFFNTHRVYGPILYPFLVNLHSLILYRCVIMITLFLDNQLEIYLAPGRFVTRDVNVRFHLGKISLKKKSVKYHTWGEGGSG